MRLCYNRHMYIHPCAMRCLNSKRHPTQDVRHRKLQFNEQQNKKHALHNVARICLPNAVFGVCRYIPFPMRDNCKSRDLMCVCVLLSNRRETATMRLPNTKCCAVHHYRCASVPLSMCLCVCIYLSKSKIHPSQTH